MVSAALMPNSGWEEWAIFPKVSRRISALPRCPRSSRREDASPTRTQVGSTVSAMALEATFSKVSWWTAAATESCPFRECPRSDLRKAPAMIMAERAPFWSEAALPKILPSSIKAP
jgi:hypothetical protein